MSNKTKCNARPLPDSFHICQKPKGHRGNHQCGAEATNYFGCRHEWGQAQPVAAPAVSPDAANVPTFSEGYEQGRNDGRAEAGQRIRGLVAEADRLRVVNAQLRGHGIDKDALIQTLAQALRLIAECDDRRGEGVDDYRVITDKLRAVKKEAEWALMALKTGGVK